MNLVVEQFGNEAEQEKGKNEQFCLAPGLDNEGLWVAFHGLCSCGKWLKYALRNETLCTKTKTYILGLLAGRVAGYGGWSCILHATWRWFKHLRRLQ